MKKFQAIRGMPDLLPEESHFWRQIEGKIQDQLYRFGYREIRLPILEATELFTRSVGDATDIVQKEMYTFADRNNDSLTLRPEGTAGCIRAVLEHNLASHQTLRLWYAGPMFRHERPQKGRHRQFQQIGAEVIGCPSADIDAELLLLNWRIWQDLGIADAVVLELNNLGTAAVRQRYRDALLGYLKHHAEHLDAASSNRLQTNPLRILDSKVPETQALLVDAPILIDFLDAESARHFDELRALLTGLGIPFVVNPRIVRGLDYYTKTVFEWTSAELGAQNAICSGGRYDRLAELLGGRATSAIGFALGMDRLALLLKTLGCQQHQVAGFADLYVIPLDVKLHLKALQLADQLRVSLPDVRIVCHTGGGKIKAAMKQADRSGAQIALLLGEKEVQAGGAAMKMLRENTEQRLVLTADIENEVAAAIEKTIAGTRD